MTWQLGDLSERYESNGDPGAVSSGKGDPGGVSYGLYQLATVPGTAADFARNEGKSFHLVSNPGSAAFGAAWKAAARENAHAFGDAQRAFIRRTHYDPVVNRVGKATGVNLDARSNPVREAVWSCAVQHGGAASILIDAVHDTGRLGDEALLRAIYQRRSAYVIRLGMRSVAEHRYRDELARALAMGGWKT